MPSDSTETEGRKQIWLRGLFMVIFAILFNIAQGLLVACAVVQFLWMLFAKERNRAVADFGEGLGRWMQAVARFQSGASEDKPFPWDDLK